MKVVVAHPGTQYSHHLAREIEKAGMLRKFVTSFGVSERSSVKWILPKMFRNRIIKGVPTSRVKSYPWLEIVSQVKSRLSANDEHVLHERNAAFQDKVIANDLGDADVVIGFDTSSWKLAEYCKRIGIRFILDVSIGHPISKEKVFRSLRSEFPAWSDIREPKKNEFIALEQREFQMASDIVVPSSFVKSTLIENSVDAQKITVIPFGTDVDALRDCTRQEVSSPIRFLFFGSLTARKGLPLLFEAWSRLGPVNARLDIAGYGQIPNDVVIPNGVTILGVVGPTEKGSLFSHADVFVFPSYFEGFAQVQIEAAASGLPIIGTTNSGATEIVAHAENGFVIPPGDVDELVKAMRFFIDHPGTIRTMGERSRERAQAFSWTAYGDRWRKVLEAARTL
jgi:starch synthase